MYFDLIVLGILLLLVVIFYSKFRFYILYFGIIEIILRITSFVNETLSLGKISKIVDKYIPGSFFDLISKYTSGTVELVLDWIFVGIMFIFLLYNIKIFIKKKKI